MWSGKTDFNKKKIQKLYKYIEKKCFQNNLYKSNQLIQMRGIDGRFLQFISFFERKLIHECKKHFFQFNWATASHIYLISESLKISVQCDSTLNKISNVCT